MTGITGQDGSYLSELLLGKGYQVYGMIRKSATDTTDNIAHLLPNPRFHLCYGDMATEHRLCALLEGIRPDEAYNLAGQSDVAASFEIPEYTGDVTGLGVTRLLEAVRRFSPKSRLYQASSSECFGNAPAPQNEETPMSARSPYACAKIYGHNVVRVYREAHGLFCCSGILFNHESPRRGLNFVTRKVSRAAARIRLGLQDRLELGNLDACRDWGYAADYVDAMWRMLQEPEPRDFVVGTGETHSVKELVQTAFANLSLNWEDHVESDVKGLVRPAEVNYLRADASKARDILGWSPSITFTDLVALMVDSDMKHEKEITCAQ